MLAVGWQNLEDFVVLAIAISLLLRWGKEVRAFRVSLGIVGLKAALLARQLDLIVTSLLLDATKLIAMILLLIVYQSELRHALTQDLVNSRSNQSTLIPYGCKNRYGQFSKTFCRC